MNTQTDHDLLLTVARDVCYTREDIAALKQAMEGHLQSAQTQRKDDSNRFRTIERVQERLQTRWKFFGWAVGILSAITTLLVLIQYFK